MRKNFSIKTIPLFFRAVCTSFFIAIIGFTPALGLAAPTCNNFEPATYKITNNGGSSNFDFGERVETDLSLFTKATINSADGDNVDIILVMDRSGSMNDPVGGIKKVQAAKDALNAVADVVAQAGNSNNRLALVTFNNYSTLNQGLTNNYNAIKVAVNAMSAQGLTTIGGGILAATSELSSRSLNPNTRKFIILASDGKNTADPTIADVLSLVPANVTIYTVGIGNDVKVDDMVTVATEGGSKKGLYFASNVADLLSIFQSIINQIIGYFLLQNLSIEFTRDGVVYTSLKDSTPVYSVYDKVNSQVKWNNIGEMANNRQKNLSLSYNAVKTGTDIPLNIPTLRVSYTIEGLSCVDTVPVNVLPIVIFSNPPPPCDEDSWIVDNRVLCDTMSYDQVNACGNHRKVKGTIHCPECSDYVDNDKDGKIDYPLDPGCTGPMDDRELNIDFNFFEF